MQYFATVIEEKLKSWKYSSLDLDPVLADLDQMMEDVSLYPTGRGSSGIAAVLATACMRRVYLQIQEHMRGHWRPAFDAVQSSTYLTLLTVD